MSMSIKQFDAKVNYIQMEFERKYPNSTASPFALKLKKRRRVFENYKASCVIDLINETGHSYDWWIMLKRINGVLCLNTYRYSVQTAKHIAKARQVLNLMGVEYTEIEAPGGLQDIESAVRHAAYEIGKATVRSEVARVPRQWDLDRARDLIFNLKRIEVYVTKQQLDSGYSWALKNRRERLDRIKANKLRRAGSLLQLAIQNKLAG